MNELFDIDYLYNFVEFDRNNDKYKISLNIYNSDNIIRQIENDIESGIGIKKPVKFVIYNGKALLYDGCHRMAAAKNKGLKHIPLQIIFKGRVIPKNKLEKFKEL